MQSRVRLLSIAAPHPLPRQPVALGRHPAGGVSMTYEHERGDLAVSEKHRHRRHLLYNKGRKTLLAIMYYILLEGAAGNVGQQDQYGGGLQGGEGSPLLLLFSGAAYTQLVNLDSSRR